MEKVLVTGATGYIGLHCIHQLLNQGYAVNGSVRTPERKNEVFEALKNHDTPTDNLNIFHTRPICKFYRNFYWISFRLYFHLKFK